MSPVPVSLVHYLDADDLSSADAVVLAGSSAPWPEHDASALEQLGRRLVASQRPTLGICAGLQLMAMAGGGEVRPMAARGAPREHGFSLIEVVDDSDLLTGLPSRPSVFQDHTDEVVTLPEGFTLLARSPRCGVEAAADRTRRWWGVQFHPERATARYPAGEQVLRNFFALAGLADRGVR